MRPFTVLAPLLALALAFPVVASPQETLDLQEVAARQQQLRTEIEAANGAYRGLTKAKQDELLQRSGAVLGTIDGKQSADDLTEAERAQVHEMLAWIDSTLAGEESGRMVCTFQKTIGSNRKTRVCKTPAQIEREREAARQQRLTRPELCPPGTSGCSVGG